MVKQARASKGWLAVLGLVQAVLLTLFGVGLGLTLTIGTPKRMAQVLTQGQSRTVIAAALNQEVLAAAQAGGLNLAVNANVATPAITAALTRQAVLASGDFVGRVSVAATTTRLEKRLRQVVKPAHTQPTAAQWQTIDRHVAQAVSKAVDALMQHGVGIAYGFVVLTLQTLTIVCAILSVIVLALMRVAAHSWWRWLRACGRLGYVIGFLGGGAALIAGMPSLSANWRFGGAPVGVVAQVITTFAPQWQRLAGIVVVIGLCLAGCSYILRPKHAEL